MRERVDHGLFITLLTVQLPEVAAQINECTRGLLHMEMGTLGLATRAAIEAEHWGTVRRHLSFVEDVFLAATPDVVNAVYASYMELLPFWDDDDGAPKVRALLPPALAKVLADMES